MGLEALKRWTNLGSGLMSQTALPIAADFGVGCLKVLQVEEGEPPKLVAAACVDTPDELREDHAKRLEFQLDAFTKLLKRSGFRGKRVVCAIPASRTFCKHMQFTKAAGVDLSSMVASVVPQQLGCDPSALVYRHVEVGPAQGGKTEVICMAAARDTVTRLLDGIRGMRMEPVGMHGEAVAMLRSFDYLNRRETDQKLATLYLDIGAGSTKIVIAHGSKMVFARMTEVGGLAMDKTIAEQLKCRLSQARTVRMEMEDVAPSRHVAGGGLAVLSAAMKKDGVDGAAKPEPAGTQGGPHGGAAEGGNARADLTEPLEILAEEVQMSVRYHDSLFPGRGVDRLVMLGGECRAKAMCQHLARVLRLPAQLADPMARVARTGKEPTSGVDFKEPQPGWAVPLGLCVSPTDL
jgi:Tfp pilus assembly PilM family ATPase